MVGVVGVQARDTACMKVLDKEAPWDIKGKTGSQGGWGIASMEPVLLSEFGNGHCKAK